MEQMRRPTSDPSLTKSVRRKLNSDDVNAIIQKKKFAFDAIGKLLKFDANDQSIERSRRQLDHTVCELQPKGKDIILKAKYTSNSVLETCTSELEQQEEKLESWKDSYGLMRYAYKDMVRKYKKCRRNRLN